MKRFFINLHGPAAAILFAATLFSFPARAAEKESPAIHINPAKSWGVWEGWGVSLCWWANVFGDRDDIADAVFTTRITRVEQWEVPGLGLNIARYNAGGSAGREFDGRRMVVSKIILPYRQMQGFWLDPKSAAPDSPSWDWSVDAKQRAMLIKARDRGADRFELFSNAPMWWMCANDNPSGAAGKTEVNLLPGQYQNFAIYLAAIARRAKEKWGISFTTVEPFNEPSADYWFADCKQEGLHFPPPQQVAFLPYLRAELDRCGLKDLPIAASDETSYTHGLKSWNAYPASAKVLVGKVNVHGYEGTKGPRKELHDAVIRDRKPLWNTEYGEKQADGLQMARCIHLDLQELRPTAWCYWQAFDHGGWGLFDTDMVNARIKGVNPKYYVLAQYTRHIRPGMKLLETGDRAVIAAHDPAARKLVLVVFNDGPARDWSCDLSRFGTVSGPVTRWVTEPGAAARYEQRHDIKLAGKSLGCTLSANSIQTFEVENVAP